MDWRDEGALLSARRHGETSAIVEMFTAEHGRHLGVVRGGAGRRMAPVLQPGAQLAVSWRARLDEHLGSFTVEPVRSRAAGLLGDRAALAALNAVTALLSYALPEREPHPQLYARTVTLLDMLGDGASWPYAYLRWEMALLDELGFGLDLGACAVSGVATDLAYVSPRSGRAVARDAAGDWADRLLPLPSCMLGRWDGALPEIALALGTTGHFLERMLAEQTAHKPLPQARQRFVDIIARQSPR